jgi:hypothetical protein
MENNLCFISTGKLSGFYTLKVLVNDYDGMGRACIKEEFVKNLSTDKQKAMIEAQDYAEKYDLILMNNPDFDLNEIKRMKHEEIERKIKEEKDRVEREKIEKREHLEKIMRDSVFIHGRHSGKYIKDVFEIDPGYVYYLKSKWHEDLSNHSDHINIHLANKWITENNIKSEFVGKDGEIQELELTYNSRFTIEGRFVSVRHTCSIGNNILMFNSVAKGFMNLEPGDRFKVKANVSHVQNIHGNKVTYLNKPKMIK